MVLQVWIALAYACAIAEDNDRWHDRATGWSGFIPTIHGSVPRWRRLAEGIAETCRGNDRDWDLSKRADELVAILMNWRPALGVPGSTPLARAEMFPAGAAVWKSGQRASPSPSPPDGILHHRLYPDRVALRSCTETVRPRRLVSRALEPGAVAIHMVAAIWADALNRGHITLDTAPRAAVAVGSNGCLLA